MTESSEQSGPRALQNWISLTGFGLMGLGFLSSLLLALVELISDHPAPYLGLLYIAFTGIIVLGFLLVPLGVVISRSRPGAGLARGFHLDLSRSTHRLALLSFLSSGLVVLLLVGIGSYKAHQATESPSFCGQLCHTVMNPEWTTYHNSSHAKVGCVECHIGSGAGWYVRSKLSGLRQIWAVAMDSYPRPIPTPIQDLRPARETCEECHWRRKFIGYKEVVRSYFLSDEQNTLHRIRMLLKIGGEKTIFMRGSGIHYHMLIASKVEYVAKDPQRQEIAWVRVKRGDGSVTEYNRIDDPLSEEERATLEVRTMDCMDCHNRPAHQFPAPMQSVNDAIEEGSIPLSLPYIKLQAVRALDVDYENTDQALTGIANSIRGFYRREYPELLERDGTELKRAISKTQNIYQSTIFPEMKAKWSAYPDNIGHRDSPGCFRCHTEDLQSSEGETIFTTCNKCHLILAQGTAIDDVNVNFQQGLAFVHPEDLETIDEYTECVDCHTGGAELYE